MSISNVFPFSKLFAAKGNEIQAAMAAFVTAAVVEPNVITGMAQPFKYLGNIQNSFDSSPTFQVQVPTLGSGDTYEVLIIGNFARITRNGTAISAFTATNVQEHPDGGKDGNEPVTGGFGLLVDGLDDSFSGALIDYVSVLVSVGIPATPIGGKAGAFSGVAVYARKVEGA